MWISTAAYLKQREEVLTLQSKCEAITATNVTLKTTLEWLMLRMTQLEAERAQLLWNYMGIKIPVPEIEKDPDVPGVDSALNKLPSFDDMGDIEAGKQGIDWAEDGSVTYAR